MVGRGVCSHRGQMAFKKKHSRDLLGDPDHARTRTPGKDAKVDVFCVHTSVTHESEWLHKKRIGFGCGAAPEAQIR